MDLINPASVNYAEYEVVVACATQFIATIRAVFVGIILLKEVEQDDPWKKTKVCKACNLAKRMDLFMWCME